MRKLSWLAKCALLLCTAMLSSCSQRTCVKWEDSETGTLQRRSKTPFSLGALNSAGTSIPTEETSAIEWIQRAARDGDANAQVLLGTLFELGKGVPKDEAKAFECYKKAADQGDARGQQQVGLMYAVGKGVPRDDVRAYLWLTQAAKTNPADALPVRDTVEKHMAPEQKAEAQELSAEIFAGVARK